MEMAYIFVCSRFLSGPLALITYLEKRRREALERVARRLGMSFSAELPEGIRSRLLQAGFGYSNEAALVSTTRCSND
jgi:hypothetical protein